MKGVIPIMALLFCCLETVAQPAVSRIDSMERNTYNIYLKGAAPFLPLYNGPVYTALYPGIKGSPFFGDTMWHEAQLQYGSVFYPQVQLAYDLVTDQLVLKSAEPISLVPEKTDYFLLGNRLFVRISKNAKEGNALPAGFYELLDQQPGWQLLAKRKKQPVRGFRAEDPYSFAGYNDYYVQRDGLYYSMNRESDLLRIAGIQKNAMKKFLRGRNLQFKKDPEATLRQAMQFFMQNRSR